MATPKALETRVSRGETLGFHSVRSTVSESGRATMLKSAIGPISSEVAAPMEILSPGVEDG